MLRLHDHDNAPWLEHLHQRVRDLTGHPLLHLGSSRVHIDQARKLRQSSYLPFLVRDIPHMSKSEERRQMMLASREHFDVPDEHHLVVIGIEDGGEYVGGRLPQTRELLRQGTSNPARGVLDPIPRRVLTDRQKYL